MPKKSNSSLQKTDLHVGGRVKTRRLELGMSQSKLGDTLGITFQQVQKYERGANRIGSSRLQSIADALGVSPSYFFIGLPEHKTAGGSAVSPAYLKKFVSSEDGMSLIRAFQKISRKKIKHSIIDLVESLAGSEN